MSRNDAVASYQPQSLRQQGISRLCAGYTARRGEQYNQQQKE
jgi:hypothetical protein